MKRYAICARIGAGVMLTVLWGLVDSPLSGVVFILVLLGLSAIRYRLAPYRSLAGIEVVVCVGYAFFWLPALLGLWLPAIGLLEKRWELLEQELLDRDFEDRTERLRLESDRENARQNIQNATRFAEMAERARIAQDIHDHVGHELSGASIALQTAIKLYNKSDDRTGELLNQSAERLVAASEHLRETVHNLKPARVPGVWSLEELCDSFGFCSVEFTAFGDLNGFVHWELLAANLKEALTNTARHSNATRLTVCLDGNARYLRMTVRDNGDAAAVFKTGMGLSGIKQRVYAAGGTFSVDTSNGFQIVCVLPKK